MLLIAAEMPTSQHKMRFIIILNIYATDRMYTERLQHYSRSDLAEVVTTGKFMTEHLSEGLTTSKFCPVRLFPTRLSTSSGKPLQHNNSKKF